MDATAVKAIGDLAVHAAHADLLGTHTPAVLTAKGIQSLEHLEVGRSRFRGRFHTTVFSEFASYVSQQEDAQIFVNPDIMSAEAFFNLGTTENPGHGDWTAALELKPTAAFEACQKIDGVRQTQPQMVRFLEDWLPHIEGRNGKETLTGDKVLAAIRQLKINASAESSHDDRDFGASRSKLESIEASSAAGKLPRHIAMTSVTPYLGFAAREIVFRFAVHPGEDPTIALHMLHADQLPEDLALEFVGKINEALGGLHPVTVGTFRP